MSMSARLSVEGMAFIAAGRFAMGSAERASEQPAHVLDIESYFIDRFPVTVGEYSRLVDATGYRFPPSWQGDVPNRASLDHPAVDVSRQDARAYATWIGRRLPTGLELEKAASHGTSPLR
jgi:formylglycine-generating enzyme required for sulfatase activity